MAHKREKGFKLKRDPSEFSSGQLVNVKNYLNSRVCFYLLKGEMDLYLNSVTIVNRINNELKKRETNEISEINEKTKSKTT